MRSRKLIVGVAFFLAPMVATPSPPSSVKENLDLPAQVDFPGHESEEAAEIIFHRGTAIEADTFIFCLDRSASMRGGKLDILKREIVRLLHQLSERSRFAIVFFDRGTMHWPSDAKPISATLENRESATAWLSTVRLGAGTCVREALVESIAAANGSESARSVLLLVTDGITTCPGQITKTYGDQTIAAVTQANFRRHPVHVRCIGTDCAPPDVDEQWCRTLAVANNGSFSLITR